MSTTVNTVERAPLKTVTNSPQKTVANKPAELAPEAVVAESAERERDESAAIMGARERAEVFGRLL